MSTAHPIRKNPIDPSRLSPAQRIWALLDMPLNDLAGIVLLFLAGFLMLADIKVGKVEVALDSQVMAKLCVIGACGIYGLLGFLADPQVRRTLFSFPVLWVVMISACFFLAVPTSITPVESLASAISIACITLATVTGIVRLGAGTVVTTLFYSLCLYVVAAWIAFLAFPEIGVYAEKLSEGRFQNRMAGIAHPNTLGQFSGLTIVLGSILYVRFGQRSMFRIGIILLAALALLFSLSRTSMVATVFALSIAFRKQLFRREYALYAVGIVLAGAIGFLVLASTTDLSETIEQKLRLLSKSGDLSELTSATGRVEIWKYASRLIAEKPLTGYGAATSKYYLEDYTYYTHNMIMHVAFSTGIFGGTFALLMCLGRILAMITHHHLLADGIIAFLLVNGFFENVLFCFLAGLPTMMWIVGCCLPHFMPLDEKQVELSLRNIE
jgi:exopolysaccharide production protein ExoQ